MLNRRTVSIAPRISAIAFALISLLAASTLHAEDAAAPEYEFKRIAKLVQTAAPGQDVVETLYQFMEKYPRDPRGDQVQLWVGQVQQKRKFHNEAIKELGYVIRDFPSSPLVTRAYRLQAASYAAIDHHKEEADCFSAIIDRKPRDFKADPEASALFREASIWLADQAMQRKPPGVEIAVALLTQLPEQREAVTRIVEVYASVEQFDNALKAIERLPDSDRLLGYQLLTRLYSARPGVTNLFNVLGRLLDKEKPSDSIDPLVQNLVAAIGGKGSEDHHKALSRVIERYPRLKRWAEYEICKLDRASDVAVLVRFVGDYRTGGDVEQCKQWIGVYYESAGDPVKARVAYWTLNDNVNAHFLVAETYYGPHARKVDLEGGVKELTEIVKRFYSNGVCCDALTRRAELQADRLKTVDTALATYRELIDRFPEEGDWPARSLMRIGQLLRSQKKPDDAIHAYEKLIVVYDKSPHLRQAWLELAACYEEKHQPDRAIETFRTMLKKFPRTPEGSQAHTILETRYKVADTEVSDR